MKVWLQKVICSAVLLLLAIGCGFSSWASLKYLGGISAAVCFIAIPIGTVCLVGSCGILIFDDFLSVYDDEEKVPLTQNGQNGQNVKEEETIV